MKKTENYSAPAVKTVSLMVPRALCIGISTSDGSGSNRTGESVDFDPDSD